MRYVELTQSFIHFVMGKFLLSIGLAASLQEALQDGNIHPKNGSSYLLQNDFENGVTGSAWTAAFPNPENTICKWNVVRGQAVNLATGPHSDHTLDNIFGHYLYLESKYCERNDMAVLLSTVLTGFESPRQCFTLWYFAYGVAGNLWIVQVDADTDPADVMSQTNKIQGIRQGNQGRDWQRVHITIDNPTKADYRLSIFGSSRSSQFGDIAVDDMLLEDRACDAPSITCDFEDGDCGGQAQGFAPGFLWNVTKARETYMQYDHTDFAPEDLTPRVPKEDANSCCSKWENEKHRTNVPYRWHMLFASGTETFFGAKTEWLTEKFTADPPQCVRFWYRLGDHPSAGMLHVNLGEDSSGSTSYEILDSFSGQINGGHLWEKGQISIVDFHYDYFLQFQAVNGEGTEFAVDDIDMVRGDCEPRVNCHFEDGMCGWANSFGEETHWWRIQGRTALLQGAGLPTDHTRHDELGYYVYLGSDMFPNDDSEKTANLYSERITRLGWNLCFGFWYHLSSSAHGISAKLTLSQILPAPVDGMQPTPDHEVIWRHTSAETRVWNYGAVVIRNDVESRLMFTGHIRTGAVNDSIGLDDFVLREGSCIPEPSSSWTCPGTDTTIQVRQLCDQHSDCPNSEDERNCGSCSFNSSVALCGYQTKNDSRFTWHFSPENPGNIVVSEDLPMNEVVSLNVYLQHGTLRTLIATYTHEHHAFVSPANWNDYDVFVGKHSTPFQIVFEARKSAFADAAGLMLRDVALEQCSFPSGTRSCSLGEWECPGSRLCINLTQVCDFVDNCGNGEDERNCQARNPVRCNFEDNLCDWTHGEPGNTSAKWLRADSSDLRDFKKECAAVRDHSSGVHGGKFLLLRSPPYSPSNPLDPGSLTGKLLSRRFRRTSSANECRLSMYVLFCGDISPVEARLVATLRGLVEREVDILLAERTGLDWFHMDIPVPDYVDLGDEYVLELRGELQYSGESVIAVDDISFSPSCEAGSEPELPEVSTTSQPSSIVSSNTSTTENVSPVVLTFQETPTTVSTTNDVSTSLLFGPSTDTAVFSSSTSSSSSRATFSSSTDGFMSEGTSTAEPSSTPCSSGRWCDSNKICLENHKICDGKSDCGDKSDERDCATQKPESQPVLTDGAIIGIAISGVAALLMVGLGAFFYRKHRQSLGSKTKASTYFNFNELDETDGTRNPGYDMDEISGNHPAFPDKRNIIKESLDES